MHWTYEEFGADTDLEQGDFLACTDDLRAVLREVHPHFCDAKYLGFVVATQSCDLVRRPSVKARYIEIATVRSLKDVLPTLLEEFIDPVAPGIYRKSSRVEAKQFLERLLNQNEQAHGLFYLHPDASIGLGESAVAFLRISVALWSQHYQLLTAARRGRLKSEFRAKFGWLIGNLYARAASPDWGDQPTGRAEMKVVLEGLLDPAPPSPGITWLDDGLVTQGIAAGVHFSDRDRSELLSELEQHRPKPAREQLCDEIIKEGLKIFAGDEERLQTLKNRIYNNGKIKRLLRTSDK